MSALRLRSQARCSAAVALPNRVCRVVQPGHVDVAGEIRHAQVVAAGYRCETAAIAIVDFTEAIG